MQSYLVSGRIDADGILRLNIPTNFPQRQVEACVVIQPLAPEEIDTSAKSTWPAGYFENTVGQWQGELERGEQGQAEERDWLK